MFFERPRGGGDPDTAPILVCPVVPAESLSSTRSEAVIQSFLLDSRIRGNDLRKSITTPHTNPSIQDSPFL